MGFAGQKSTATRRIIVVGDPSPFLEALEAALPAADPGDPDDAATTVGPVITEGARQGMLDAVALARRDGARVLEATASQDSGWYVAPTILSGLPSEHQLLQEETFGPLAAVLAASTREEAVRLANGVRYGLVSSVHGRDLDELLATVADLETGMVRVNAPATGVDFYLPFGGDKESSVGPREQGKAAMAFYSSPRTVTIATGGWGPPLEVCDDRATMAAPSQLQQISLREQALAFIRQGMATGELQPGEIYSASGLALQLGVSNSPVREAMLHLVQQGLMETVRNRGFRIVPLSDKDRWNIYQLRMDLEVPAMGRVAESGRVTGRELEFRDLASGIVASETAGDMVGYLEYDRQFHLGLIGLLDNPQLTSIVETLRDKTRLYGVRALSERGMLAASAAEHQPILDAVAAGDRRLAQKLTRAHLQHIQLDWSGNTDNGPG